MPPRQQKKRSSPVVWVAMGVATLIVMQNFRVLFSMLHLDVREDGTAAPPSTIASLTRQTSFQTFVVWTYPGSPGALPPSLAPGEILLCAYSAACKSDTVSLERFNLLDLARNTPYESFVENHALYKITKRHAFLHHVQSVTLLSLLTKYPDKCARTWGDDKIICKPDLDNYQKYDPTNFASVPPLGSKNAPFLRYKFNVFSFRRQLKVEDEMQSLTTAQYMPFVSATVDQEAGLVNARGILLANAGFTQDFKLPSSANSDWNVKFSSVNFAGEALKTVQKHAALLQANSPMGAMDPETLAFLQNLGIPSYLALSFLLMWNGKRRDSDEKVPVVIDVLPGAKLPKGVAVLNSTLEKKEKGSLARFRLAQDVLDKYATRAKVVITSNIQLALPAIVMGIPVIFVGNEDHLESSGLDNTFHVHNPKNTTWNLELNRLPPKEGLHRLDRARASFWNLLKRESSHIADAATLYGLVPLTRLGRSNEEDVLFHFIFTTSPDSFSWRERRAIEYVLYHHPNAKVIVHSNALPDVDVDIFRETGYDVTVQPYDLKELLEKSKCNKILVNEFVSKLGEFATGPHWYSHETDILRYLLLSQHGGVYLDTDMYLIKPLPKEWRNVVAYQDPNHDFASGGLMKFDKGHDMLAAALDWILRNYADRRDEWPVLGSTLVTEMHKNDPDSFRVMLSSTFYPIDWENIEKCFTDALQDLDLSQTYAIHLNAKITSHYNETIEGTFCDDLLHRYCIFCDEIHTVKNDRKAKVPDSPADAEDESQGTSKAEEVSQRTSFLSRIALSVFGSSTAEAGLRKAIKAPPPVPAPIEEEKVKVLPQVHMRFAEKN